jgi:hypothetical protein
MLHALPMESFSNWSPKQYLVRSTEHKVPRYVVLSFYTLRRLIDCKTF